MIGVERQHLSTLGPQTGQASNSPREPMVTSGWRKITGRSIEVACATSTDYAAERNSSQLTARQIAHGRSDRLHGELFRSVGRFRKSKSFLRCSGVRRTRRILYFGVVNSEI